MADPLTMSAASMAASGGGGILGAVGSIFSGNAQSSMYQYQSAIAAMNANIAKSNADYAVAAGEVGAQQSGMKTASQVGQTIAQQGAGGLAVGSGSNARVVDSERAIGQEDQALIRANAAKTAYGYEVIAAQDTAQAQLDTMAASNAKTAGEIGAFGSLLGSGGSVASKWLQANQAGVFSGGGGSDGPAGP